MAGVETLIPTRSHYREVDGGGLDRKGQMPIAASPLVADNPPDLPAKHF